MNNTDQDDRYAIVMLDDSVAECDPFNSSDDFLCTDDCIGDALVIEEEFLILDEEYVQTKNLRTGERYSHHKNELWIL